MKRFDEWLKAAAAPALFRALETFPADGTGRYRLRLASILSTREALEAMDSSLVVDPETELLYARVLMLRGALDEALERVDRASTSEVEVCSVALLRAEILGGQGKFSDAVEVLRRLQVNDEFSALQRDAHLGRYLQLAGAVEDARALVQDLEPRIACWSGEDAKRAVRAVLFVLGNHQVERARELADRLVRETSGADRFTFTGRQARFACGFLEIELGRLRDSRRRLSELLQWEVPGLRLHAAISYGMARCCLIAGDSAELEELLEERAHRGQPDLSLGFEALAVDLARIRAREPEDTPPGQIRGPEPWASNLRLAYARHRARWARAGSELIDPEAAIGPEQTGLAQIAVAEDALAKGEDARARRWAREARQYFSERGFFARAGEAAVVEADHIVIHGAERMTREVRQTLDRLREAEPFKDLLALNEWALGTERRPSVLAQLSSRAATEQPAVRRARALLGYPASLDRIDQRWVEAVRERLTWRVYCPAPPNDAVAPSWGFDAMHQVVWRSERVDVDLSRYPLLTRILTVLCEERRANKEELIVGAWDEPEYHPLRHDNRLRVAIRKLRQLVESEPSKPEMILWDGEGSYLLSGDFRYVTRRETSEPLPPFS